MTSMFEAWWNFRNFSFGFPSSHAPTLISSTLAAAAAGNFNWTVRNAVSSRDTLINRTASSSQEIRSLSKRSTFPSHYSPQTFVRVITSTLPIVSSSCTVQHQLHCKISLVTIRRLRNKIPHHRKKKFRKLQLSSSCLQIFSYRKSADTF